VYAVENHRRVKHRNIQRRALSSLGPLQERGQNCCKGGVSGEGVDRSAEQGADAGNRSDGTVDCDPFSHRTIMAVPRYRTKYQTLILLAEVVSGDSEALGDAGAEIFNDDVRLGDKLHKNISALRRGKIERYRSLSVIRRDEAWIAVRGPIPSVPEVVTDPRPLNLQDCRAEFLQHMRAKRTSDAMRQVNHGRTRQRQR
jgi:hypothetical protein